MMRQATSRWGRPGYRYGRSHNENLIFIGIVMAYLVLSLKWVSATYYAPNQFLGRCLDEVWADTTATSLQIFPGERDNQGRLVHPFLRAALKTPRFTINDPRTNDVPMKNLFQSDCGGGTAGKIYGVGSQVDPNNGTILDHGSVSGSLIAEIKSWPSHGLTTMLFAIIAREVLGYPVSLHDVTDYELASQRMSSVHSGICAPVHLTLEEWYGAKWSYLNETYKVGSIGYAGRSGVYTIQDFVERGADQAQFSPPFNADFWRDYSWHEGLIKSLRVADLLSNTKYPPSTKACPNDISGCRDGCSRTYACTEWEAAGKECMVVVLMYEYYDIGYIQAVFANKNIPAYFCFLGYTPVENYAIEAHENGTGAVFYHFEPDVFHFANEGKFTRIFLPRWDPEIAMLATNSFGETGYGGKTTNPVNVDFPTQELGKFASKLLLDDPLLANFLSSFTIDTLIINKMLKLYVNITAPSGGVVPIVEDAPLFSSACSWLRDNYMTWSMWLDHLPLCDFTDHMKYTVTGCSSALRTIRFSWATPDPDNAAKPHACDGGDWGSLPGDILTSRSCEWISSEKLTWRSWIKNKPPCDSSFYTFDTSACDSNAKRAVIYRWLLPNPLLESRSLECQGSFLPEPVELDCEYVPYSTPVFTAVAIISGLLVLILTSMIGVVYWYRDEPIIKRSQWVFLIVMTVGGILMCISTILYAGEPTTVLCGARPLVTSTAFTLIFGSLLMKSLRVYRVFMSGAMKRVVLSLRKMLKMLTLTLLVDIFVIVVWFALDFPAAMSMPRAEPSLGGAIITHRVCASSSFIFSALLIFWKAIVLIVGLYLSFLIRKVSTDFQESIWIFSSSLVVVFASVVVLPMAYLVDLPARTFYVFLAFALLVSTAIVTGMMLIPKVRRLHEQNGDTQTYTESSDETATNSSTEKWKQKASRLKQQVTASKKTVTPIIPIGSDVSSNSNRPIGKINRPRNPKKVKAPQESQSEVSTKIDNPRTESMHAWTGSTK